MISFVTCFLFVQIIWPFYKNFLEQFPSFLPCYSGIALWFLDTFLLPPPFFAKDILDILWINLNLYYIFFHFVFQFILGT